MRLRLLDERPFETGMVYLRYSVEPAATTRPPAGEHPESP
jgi:hypothetical protein